MKKIRQIYDAIRWQIGAWRLRVVQAYDAVRTGVAMHRAQRRVDDADNKRMLRESEEMTRRTLEAERMTSRVGF